MSDTLYTPPPLYNTIVGVQASFRVSYPNRVITRVKCIDYIGKGTLNSHLGSNSDSCYIQNHVIMNRVIKRFRCIDLASDCNKQSILNMATINSEMPLFNDIRPKCNTHVILVPLPILFFQPYLKTLICSWR